MLLPRISNFLIPLVRQKVVGWRSVSRDFIIDTLQPGSVQTDRVGRETPFRKTTRNFNLI